MKKRVEKRNNTKKMIIAGGALMGTGALAAAAVTGLRTAADKLFTMAVVNERSNFDNEQNENEQEKHAVVESLGADTEKYKDEIDAGRAWKRSMPFETVYIRSFDKLRLAAEFLTAPDAKGTVILAHGYRSSAEYDFSCAMQYYYEKGYNLLLVHQRAHGLSEGEYITYGVKESRDITDWARWTEGHIGEDKDIFLAGVSMGATTVLMASGLDLPSNVRGIIADCGFTSPRDIFKYIMKKNYHAPSFPLVNMAERVSKKKAGFGFKDADTRKALARNNRIPVLFVHGGGDEFVPIWMTIENYEACNADKEILLVEGAEHAMSYLTDREAYTEALDEFFAEHASR